MKYNIYCDESCYTQNDREPVMAIGAIWCPKDHVRGIGYDIREIKEKYGLKREFEVKWVKVSPGRLDLYSALVEYFFESKDLHFRGIVIPDKSLLNHEAFRQEHDDWYYKMFYNLLKAVINTENQYNVYIDIKDTRSQRKVDELREVLRCSFHDWGEEVIVKTQHIRARESDILQLADLMTGVIMYRNRGILTSGAKKALVNKVIQKTRSSLKRNTPLSEKKFNILIWKSSYL